jgi:hypothetical protein
MTKSREEKSHDPGRRKFLKGVGIAGAGAAIADHLWVETQAAATPESLSGTVKVVLDVNGQKREAQVEPRTTLLNTLRNHLDPAVTGPKLVCDVGTCGACTVLLDDKPVYSCLVLAVDATNKKITTVEGFGHAGKTERRAVSIRRERRFDVWLLHARLRHHDLGLSEEEPEPIARGGARSMQGQLLSLRNLSACFRSGAGGGQTGARIAHRTERGSAG